MNKILVPVVLSFTILLTACGGGGGDEGGSDGGSNADPTNPTGSDKTAQEQSAENLASAQAQISSTNTTLKNVDLSNASGLIITDSTGASIQATNKSVLQKSAVKTFDGQFSANTLYKIKADGSIEEVSLTTAEGDDLRGTIKPINMTDMGNGWSIFSFESSFPVIYRDFESIIYTEDGTGVDWSQSVNNYYVNNEIIYVHYLVHRDTGIAYKADWAGATPSYDFGDDGFLDWNIHHIDGTTPGTDYFNSGYYTDIYEESFQPGAFDDSGKMYVVGIFSEIDSDGHLVENYRVIKVNTDNVGADSITAEVIQTVDLDKQVFAHSVRVSGDGKLLTYVVRDEATAITRVVNLEAQASYNLLSIESLYNHTLPIKGRDGNLYFIYTSTQDSFLSNGLVGKLAIEPGAPKPSFVNTGVLNGSNSGATLFNYNGWPIDHHVVNGRDIFSPMHYPSNARTPDVMFELDIVNATQRVITLDELGFSNSLQDFTFNNDSFFFFGRGEDGLERIARWTPGLTEETSEVNINTDTFDVKRFKVLDSDSIIFEADVLNPWTDGTLSLVSGMKVLAEADFEGNVTIVDTIEAGDAVILVMERINQGDFLVVDGSAQDWPIDSRFVTDAQDDTYNHDGGDLTYLSEHSTADFVWLMAELSNELNGARLVVDFSDTQSVVYQSGTGTWIENDVEADLLSQLGTYAAGSKVVEFRLPANLATDYTAGGSTFYTEIDKEFGSTEGVTLSFDNLTQSYTVSVTLTSPVGPTEVIIALSNDYELRITDDNWNELNASSSDDVYNIELVDVSNVDAEVVTSLNAADGSYQVDGSIIDIELPFASLDLAYATFDDTLSTVTFITEIDTALATQNINLNDEYSLTVNATADVVTAINILKAEDSSSVALDAMDFVQDNDQLTVTLAYSAIAMDGETKPSVESVEEADILTGDVTSAAEMIAVPVDMQ